LFVSPTTDTSWGLNRLENGKRLKGKNASVKVQLPYPLSAVNRYDIMLIDPYGNIERKMNVAVTADSRILTSQISSTMRRAW